MGRDSHVPDAGHDVAACSDRPIGDRAAGTARGAQMPMPQARHQSQPSQVQVRERNGVWEVRVDGIFRGDCHRSEHAQSAAARLRESL